MKKKRLRLNLILCGLFLLLIVVGITYKLLPNTLSNFVAIENVWSGETATSFSGGNGTVDNPYQISRGEELAYFKKVIEGNESDSYKDKYYVITDNIDMAGLSFEPIGIENKTFSGHFDGQGHTIVNLKINDSQVIKEKEYSGLFSVVDGATISNINLDTITIDLSKENDIYFGTLSGSTLNNSNLNNISINNVSVTLKKKSTTSSSNFGNVSGYLENSKVSNVFANVTVVENKLLKTNAVASLGENTSLNNIYINSNISYTDLPSSIYTKDTITDDFFDNLNKGADKYIWVMADGVYTLTRVEDNKSSNYDVVVPNFEVHDSGIVGNIVYINDMESDYNYFMGLNYTTSLDGSLPTMENKNLYSNNNLVKMQISYFGSVTTNGKDLNASVSTTEPQDTFVYYKTLEVNDNGTPSNYTDDYVLVELIDNPFTNRPKDYGFNGWQTSAKGVTISFDSEIYTRYAKVPVTYKDGVPESIAIDFSAVWVVADIYFVTSNSTTHFTNAIRQFNDTSMQRLEIQRQIIVSETVGNLEDKIMDGYYTRGTASYNQNYPANSFDQYGDALTGRCRSFWGDCTYYQSTDGQLYNRNTTYYEIVGGTMQAVDEVPPPVEYVYDYEDLFSQEDNMSSYYEQVTLRRGENASGYYDASGQAVSGNCNQTSCTYYQLIQYYDESGNFNTFDRNKEYYYLVTRDTNIVVLQSNLTGSWGTTQTKPLTFTGSYGGTKYPVTWTITNTYVSAGDDLVIENIIIYSNKTRTSENPANSTANTTSKYFYGNYYNTKFGRGITKSQTTQVNFVSAYGGNNSATGSASAPTKYRFVVESGFFETTSVTSGRVSTSSSRNVYVNATAIYGNDYDRVSNNNDNFDVYFSAAGSWGNNIRSSDYDEAALYTIVKSGKIGSARPTSLTNTDASSFSHGLYVGGRSYGGNYTTRKALIEGGWIYNLIGGPLSQQSNENRNDTFIYVKGGEVDAINGGAGQSTTYGNRIIQVTGGTINYSVFGGSNGVSGSGTDGALTGSPYIYIGGNAVIGSEEYVNANSNLFGFEAGSVFGIGNGRQNYDSIGTANNSYIIINDDALVRRNVYGGGNYGAVGIQVSSSETYIDILNGTVNGSIFGGGNRNGSGQSNRPASVYINMENGTVNGSIYGGSNESGTIYGDVTINHTGGTINTDIYGGGYGGYSNTSDGTYVSGNVNINIGSKNSNETPIIEGSVYGGSAFGTVNGTTRNTTVANKKVTVTVDKGTVKKSVFGGGKGNSTFTPYVLGDIDVNINDGNITDVFGGNDAAGTPNGEINVYLNGGVIGRTFGGGNNASVHTNHVYLAGATVTQIFGGSNSGGTVDESNIITTSGIVDTIYGGNNSGGETDVANVTINGGTIKEAVYGGGRLATSGETNVIVNETNIPSVYGGGEQASVRTNTNVTQNGGQIGQLFGGSNAGGDIANSYIIINNGTATDVFGGNNADGITSDTSITVNNGTITNIYGGGNQVGVTNSNVYLSDGKIENVYGGSNQNGDVSKTLVSTKGTAKDTLNVVNVYGGNNLGGTTNNTEINLVNGHYTNIFGGGNQAISTGSSEVVIQDVMVEESVYGGGNQAAIHGDSTVHVYGVSNIKKNVFGGGNHGAIGEEGKDSSTVKVHLAGAKVGGNVYGGCNTSVVYGVTEVYIGKSALQEHEGVIPGDISVTGTIFGGGEANEAGSDVYDYNAISVTKGITVLVDGTGYGPNDLDFVVTGSIFGSGNASSSAGPSSIYIRKLGERGTPDTAVSIQRADIVTLDDSHLELTGTTDRTNEYSTIKYSLNRIDKFVIKNDSSLLLRENANMLKEFDSAVDIDGKEVKASVQIDDESKTITKNVDNRLYLLAGNNLNVTTNENASEYGVVSGMTFMGMYQTYSNGTYVYGMYDESKTYGSSGDASDVLIGGSYVLGLHNVNHDITVDGFYTNYIDDDYTEITTAYIDPTPKDTNFYRWIIGTASVNYEFDLTASKYSSLGTYELQMMDFTKGNTIFNVIGFNADGLTEGVVLKDSFEVPKIATNPDDANRVMGLAMKAETIEWANYGTTKYLKDPKSSYEGTTTYESDSQDIASSLMFYLYHAKNISSEEELGTVVITLQALIPKNEIEYEVKLITISININTKIYDLEDAYDASITYAKAYEMPATTTVNITNKSQFTAYYSLFANTDKTSDFYGHNNENYHALVSNYALPVGTKITMLDFGFNETNPRHYYFIVDEATYQDSVRQLAENEEIIYPLSKFIRMDSIDADNNYKDAENNKIYYHDDLNYLMEEYIFIFDFYDTTGIGEQTGNKIIMEIRDPDDFTLYTVLGIRQDIMTYNLYEASNITLSQTIKYDSDYLYYDTQKDFSYDSTVGYKQTELRQSIVDTNYESSSMGLNITFYDTTGEQISSSLLASTSITIDGTTYYVDSNGVFRIKLSDKVSNLSRTLQLVTGNTLPAGRYTMKVSLFASSDGLHNSSDLEEVVKEIELTVVGDQNLIVVDTEDESKLIIGETGLNMNNSKVEKFSITYDSVLKDPNIRVALYKRDTSSPDSILYNEVDINMLFTDSFTEPTSTYIKQSDYEYMISTSPKELTELTYNLQDELQSGTYKLVFKLYNENELIDEDFEYIIVRKDIPFK